MEPSLEEIFIISVEDDANVFLIAKRELPEVSRSSRHDLDHPDPGLDVA